MVTAAAPSAKVRSSSAVSTVGAWLRFATATSTASTAPGAITMPAPESRSTPVASMSSAAPVMAVSSWACVRLLGPSAPSNTRAPMAAAWGAAEEAPQKNEKPGVVVRTQVAAARSGFWSSFPPVEEKLPAVMGVPSGSKKIRRGPSELEVRTDSVPSKTPPLPPAPWTATAATEMAFSAAECPNRLPAVETANCPSRVSRRRNRSAAPEVLTMIRRLPVWSSSPELMYSYGSRLPSWILVELSSHIAVLVDQKQVVVV